MLSSWRVGAAVILAVMTAAVALTPQPPTATTGPSEPSNAQLAALSPPAATDHVLKDDDAGASTAAVLPDTTALPPGVPFTTQGSGTFDVVPGRRPAAAPGDVTRYSVSVEAGLDGVDPQAFAARIHTALSDPRGWAQNGRTFEQVDEGAVDWQVTLASPMTVRTLCGYEIPVETSCWSPDTHRVVINLARWIRGSVAYIGDANLYRTYMLNHEIAHALGHGHAHDCLADGRAPVMMQQTLGTRSTTGQICQPNPWPFPVGAATAPGAEQPDTNQNSEYAMSAD